MKSFVFKGEEVDPSDLSKLEFVKRDLAILEKEALNKEQDAKKASFKNQELNLSANKAAESWHALDSEIKVLESKLSQKSYNVLLSLALLAMILAAVFGLGAFFMGHIYLKFILAFLGIFILATLS